MFSQITAPAGFEGWLVCAAAALVMIERGMAFYKNHMRELPPPSQTYVTKEDCHAAHASAAGTYTRLQAEVEELKGERVVRAEQASHLVDSLRREMSASFTRVHQRIDDLPDKMIATLRNTGALRQ